MNNSSEILHSKVHEWIDGVSFQFNGSQTDETSNITTSHYYFETFNFFENVSNHDKGQAKFMCFDTYGETVEVETLLDLQTAFFENISQL